jgi:hypothetical protein
MNVDTNQYEALTVGQAEIEALLSDAEGLASRRHSLVADQRLKANALRGLLLFAALAVGSFLFYFLANYGKTSTSLNTLLPLTVVCFYLLSTLRKRASEAKTLSAGLAQPFAEEVLVSLRVSKGDFALFLRSFDFEQENITETGWNDELSLYGAAAPALPEKAVRDAEHIALAAIHNVPYLVTWNFRHIANPVTSARIESVLRLMGYTPSVLCSPELLLSI